MAAAGLSILAIATSTTKSESHCYSVWRFPYPQRCFTAQAPVHIRTYHDAPTGNAGMSRERQIKLPLPAMELPLPAMDFPICPEGDERLKGIAFLRALSNAP